MDLKRILNQEPFTVIQENITIDISIIIINIILFLEQLNRISIQNTIVLINNKIHILIINPLTSNIRCKCPVMKFWVGLCHILLRCLIKTLNNSIWKENLLVLVILLCPSSKLHLLLLIMNKSSVPYMLAFRRYNLRRSLRFFLL